MCKIYCIHISRRGDREGGRGLDCWNGGDGDGDGDNDWHSVIAYVVCVCVRVCVSLCFICLNEAIRYNWKFVQIFFVANFIILFVSFQHCFYFTILFYYWTSHFFSGIRITINRFD